MKKDKSLNQIFDEKQINDLPLPEYVYVKARRVKGQKMPPEGTRVNQFDEFFPGMISPVSGEIREQLRVPVDGKDRPGYDQRPSGGFLGCDGHAGGSQRPGSFRLYA